MKTLILAPYPRELNWTGDFLSLPKVLTLSQKSKGLESFTDGFVADLSEIAGVSVSGDGMPITLSIQANDQRPEGYMLETRQDGISLTGNSVAGLYYGAQTLLQLMTLNGPELPLVRIVDWPQFKVRELMLDMGRGVFTMDLLKRCVRIMARLKLNTLHLHLCDDQLNSLKFDKLPLGQENPWAIGIAELGQLVRYARRYHMSIVPEIETWGHVGSILHHYPELYGAPGMWEGFAFGVGEETYSLIEKMLDEVVSVMEDDCAIHLGLDEANWALLPSAQKEEAGTHTPETLVGRLYGILQTLGKKHGKNITMRCWADHGGRPVPEEIRDRVIVEPWQYHEYRGDDIRAKVEQFSGEEKAPFMLGAGMSSNHLNGAWGATRIWAQAAADSPNCEGIDICLWESNDIAGHMIGIFAGADYAWSPETPALVEGDTLRERTSGLILRAMKDWQAAFADADPSLIRKDMGYEVYRGYYVEGPMRGKPVAVTSTLENPRGVETLAE